MKTVPGLPYVLLPFLTSDSQSPKNSEDEVADDARKKNGVLDPVEEDDKSGQGEATNTNSTNRLNTVSSSINTVSSFFTTIDLGRERAQRNEFESVFGQDKDANGNSMYRMFTLINVAGSYCDNLCRSISVNAATLLNDDLPTDPLMHEDTANLLNPGIFSGAYDDEDVGAEADLNNLEITMNISPIPTTRIYKDHPKNQIIGDINSATQTRRMTKISKEHAGRTPLIDFMKPFGCPVTILNTRDHLGKFDGKADEGFFVGYFVVSKAMRVFNKRIRIVEETLNIRFLENAPNVIGNGPDWLFDVDSLIISMNYVPILTGNQANGIAGTRDNIDSKEDVGMKPTEVNESGASDKGEEDKQDTISDAVGPSFTNDDPSSPVNAAEVSNAFADHLFE
ncbi:putative ribonuclease H-like domain-containing protein [Tanacetum coccineum]